MASLSEQVNQTYGSRSLTRKLLASMDAAGLDLARLTTEDLITFDELHVMGRKATRALGRMAQLNDEMEILDIGSGLGGPARTLAQAFGCHVTGVDLADEYVEAANELSRRVGLARKTVFQRADALDLPFESGRFDAVCMFHVSMNIRDKTALFREAGRVLKPGAPLALWEICSPNPEEVIYPVPWAADSRFSHLLSIPELKASLSAAGFELHPAEDASAEARTWIKERLAAMGKPRTRRPAPDLNLVLTDFRLRRTNVSKNLLNETISILRAVARQKTASGL